MFTYAFMYLFNNHGWYGGAEVGLPGTCAYGFPPGLPMGAQIVSSPSQ